MDSKKYDLLKAVLGHDGAAALEKAADRLGGLEDAILPRAIMAWLGVAARGDYEGPIPGVDDSYLDFTKNENGSYSGSIAMGEGVLPFQNATQFHLAASIAFSLGTENLSSDYEDVDLVKLGKAIDIMAKAKYIANIDELAKALPGPAHQPTTDAVIQGAKGQPTPPTKQREKGPRPVATRKPPKQAKTPKVVVPKKQVKLPGAKAKSVALPEAAKKSECNECGLPLIKSERFVGCMCFKDVAPYVSLSKNDRGTYINFANTMDEDAIATILETLGVSHG